MQCHFCASDLSVSLAGNLIVDRAAIALKTGELTVPGLGCHQLADPLLVLFHGQPALGVRGAEQVGHLVAVGVGGTEVATSNRADIPGFRDVLSHHPKLVRRPTDRGKTVGASGPAPVNSGSSLTLS